MHSAAQQKTFQQSLHTCILFEDMKAIVFPLEEFGLVEEDIFFPSELFLCFVLVAKDV